MSRWWIAGALLAGGVFVVGAGRLHDVARVVIWEAVAAVGLLI